MDSSLANALANLIGRHNDPPAPIGLFRHDFTPEQYKKDLNALHREWKAYLDLPLGGHGTEAPAFSDAFVTWERWANEAGYFLSGIEQTDGVLIMTICLARPSSATEIVCDQLQDKVLFRLHHIISRMIRAGLPVTEDALELQIADSADEPLPNPNPKGWPRILFFGGCAWLRGEEHYVAPGVFEL
jgi:hypothetical protein